MSSRDHLQVVSVSAKMWLISIGVILLVASSKALYEGCDHTYNLNANSVAYLRSPYYPSKYPSATSCRYKFVAPMNYEIYTECTISLDKNPQSCSTEYFFISPDGDPNLTGAEQFCGSGYIPRTTLFRTLVIAYESRAPYYNSSVGGNFNCKLTTRPQVCDCGWSQSTRIVGGVATSKNEFPSMVGLYHVPSKTVFCGGTIINECTIATAAHCTRLYKNANEILIIAGDHDLSSSTESPYATTYSVTRYIEHPNYNPSTEANDIALLITSQNIEWSRGVGPICLPWNQTGTTFDYDTVDVVGWGTTSFAGSRSPILQKAAVNVLPNSVCQGTYPQLNSMQMCTYYPNRDACQYDSGGPVYFKGAIRQYLLGIISYGSACATNPGVNTRITSYLSWIERNSCGSFCYKPFV